MLHPELASFPRQLQDDLEHARRFSIASYGAASLYNLLVAENAVAAGLPLSSGLLDELHASIEGTASERAELKDWRLGDLWATVSGKGHTIPSRTRQFVESIVAIFVQKPLGYVHDANARQWPSAANSC